MIVYLLMDGNGYQTWEIDRSGAVDGEGGCVWMWVCVCGVCVLEGGCARAHCVYERE